MTENAKDVESAARAWAEDSDGIATVPSLDSRQRMADDLRVNTAKANRAGFYVNIQRPGDGPRFRLTDLDPDEGERFVSPRLRPEPFARWLDGFVTGCEETERGTRRELAPERNPS